MADEDTIRARAKEIWKREGMPEGRAEQHWEQARRELELDSPDGVQPDELPDDLQQNPGIGTSPGMPRPERTPAPGENTFEGDVENDTTRTGGIDPNQRGRTNP